VGLRCLVETAVWGAFREPNGETTGRPHNSPQARIRVGIDDEYGQFHKGQPVWVLESDGSQRAADVLGEGEMSAWFGVFPP
jgi:hypothetical protein